MGNGIGIVDLSVSTAGRFASKLFALTGERVTRFCPVSERAERDGRSLAALRHTYLDVEDATFVDWEDATARRRVDDAVAAADVVLTSFEAGRYDTPYDDARIRALNPDAVLLTISPFGLTGPYRTHRTSSLVDWAASGYLAITGEPDREPLAGPAELCAYVTGYTATVAVEAGLAAQRRRGGGFVHLDLSVMESMLSVHNMLFSRTSYGEPVLRTGNDVGPGTYPHITYAGPDGNLFLGIVTDEEWDRLVIAIDRPELATDERFQTGMARKANRELVDAVVRPWVAATPVDEAAAMLQARHIPATRECSAADILRDVQIQHRGYLRPYTVGDATVLGPGDPLRTDPVPAGLVARGERAARPASSGDRPLAGVTVLDVSLWWAGPSATRILGDLGARVIRLERPDTIPIPLPPSQLLVNEKMNRNKLGAAINLRTDEGRDLARRLAERADVIVQNYRPGVLDRLGLGYEAVARANPGVVYVSLSGFGARGPKSDWGSYGTLIEAASSFRSRTRYPDGGPGLRLGTQLPDGIGGLAGAFAALRGLRRRTDTGLGVHYDLSQLETYVAVCGEGILAASLGDDELARGATDPDTERVLRCAGDDSWIAVALHDEHDRALVLSRYGSAGDAYAWEVLAAVAATRDRRELAAELQDLGIAAFPVATGPDIVADPQVAARGFLIDVDRGDAQGRLPGSPLRALDASLVAFTRNAPRLGEHSVEVLRDHLGLSEAEIAALVERKVVSVAQPIQALPK